MKRILSLLYFLLSACIPLLGQELFPATEPASTMPKGVTGIRGMYETFKENPSQRIKHWDALRLMYGLTGKLTIMLTASGSNHHPRSLPEDLTYYFANHHKSTSKSNPFLFEGLNFYAKYRVISLDEQQKHLRVAVYGEAAKSFVPHDEAEPYLMGDNSGYGGGVIVTQLYKRFAASFTGGFVHPFAYRQSQPEVTILPGQGYHYNLSLGYRLFPIRYDSYQNVNVNVYLEFINKHYEAASATVDGKRYNFNTFRYVSPYSYSSLQENKYSEVRPSIQFIFNSNTRIDVGIAYPLYNRSYLHFYPMYFFQFQKYLFPGNKK